MTILISDKLHLDLLEDKHADPIFKMIETNRQYLKVWLSFVEAIKTPEAAMAFVKGSQQRNREGKEYAFVVVENNEIVGRIGIYKIDQQHKTGEIGYWLIENKQGKGLMTQCCKALVGFCFGNLQLNRIEIRCGTGNLKSKSIPERLNFKREGIMRQGEFLNDHFNDLYIYSLLKSEQDL